MSCNAFSLYTNIFGIITGSFSLITLAFGFRSYLPSNRIKTLDTLFEDTEKIFTSAIEDGLLPRQHFREQAYRQLFALREGAAEVRSRAYRATTWTRDCKEFSMGLSFKIGRMCFQLKELRAEIITSSEAERLLQSCNVRHTGLTGTPPTDCTDSSDDRTDSDATSVTISECPEINLADGSKFRGRVDVFANSSSSYWPDNILDDHAEPPEQHSLQRNSVDGSRSTPTDIEEAGTRNQIDGADEPVPCVNLPVTRSDIDRTLSTQTTPSKTLDLGGHGPPQGCAAEPVAS